MAVAITSKSPTSRCFALVSSPSVAPARTCSFAPEGGGYETVIGWGDPEATPPPAAARFVLRDGSEYEMTDRSAWHSVRPLEAPVFSLMVIGPLFEAEPAGSQWPVFQRGLR